MKEIPLSRGMVALVDDEDFDWLSQWKWSALKVGRKGAPAHFYACRMQRKGEYTDKPKMILMHREIARVAGHEVGDHRDNDGLNNRRYNIRPTSQGLNSLNHAGHRDRLSRFKGVWWHRQNRKWIADFRGKYIGSFQTEELAAAAYDAAALAYSPEFALLNSDIGGANVGRD